jgi:hypothetical protein
VVSRIHQASERSLGRSIVRQIAPVNRHLQPLRFKRNVDAHDGPGVTHFGFRGARGERHHPASLADWAAFHAQTDQALRLKREASSVEIIMDFLAPVDVMLIEVKPKREHFMGKKAILCSGA